MGGHLHTAAAFPPGKPRYTLNRRLGGPPPGFNPLTVQPVATAETKVKVNPLLNMPAGTEGLEWGERSSLCPGRFTTGNEPRYLLQKTLGGAQGGLDGVRSRNSPNCDVSDFWRCQRTRVILL